VSSVRQEQLRDAKRRATGLLVAVTAAFVAVSVSSPEPGSLLGYVQAALEASMVGGLADWFAVTAIFRRPLGLPLPHVAVIPQRKDAFGRTLGEFIQENLLDPAAVIERIEARRVVPRTADWLADPEHADRVASHIVDLVTIVSEMIRDEDLHQLVEQEFHRVVGAFPVAPMAGKALRMAAANGRDLEFLEALLPAMERLMEAYRQPLRSSFADDAPWWLPKGVEKRIFDRLYEGLKELITEVRADPGHKLRERCRVEIDALATRLETSPTMRARGEELKQRLLTDPAVRRVTEKLGERVRAAILERTGEPEIRRALADMVVSVGRRLQSDPALQAKAQHVIESAVAKGAERFGDDIADLVGTQVARWDSAVAARKLELLLGADLQYIRINGTVVGGLAGLVIHAGAQLIG
jgi:uncharacterized membrane-anchored protein YjiN (DUF445 family)